jgi:hypothetical protein
MIAPSSTLNDAFLALLPTIERHGQICFRHIRCPDRKADKIAEMAALAWKWFLRLHERGKDVNCFKMTFVFLVGKAVRSGRRLTGMEKSKDVFSERAQRRRNFKVESLGASTRTSYETRYANPRGQDLQDIFEERLADNTVTPPCDAAAFRVDFPVWISSLSERDRGLIGLLMRDERTQDVARKFAVSPARISQKRREFHEDWLLFHGEGTGLPEAKVIDDPTGDGAKASFNSAFALSPSPRRIYPPPTIFFPTKDHTLTSKKRNAL